MGLNQNGIQVVEQLNNNPDKVKLKSLNGYDSMRENIDQGNTLTVKHPVVSGKKKQKSVLVYN